MVPQTEVKTATVSCRGPVSWGQGPLQSLCSPQTCSPAASAHSTSSDSPPVLRGAASPSLPFQGSVTESTGRASSLYTLTYFQHPGLRPQWLCHLIMPSSFADGCLCVSRKGWNYSCFPYLIGLLLENMAAAQVSYEKAPKRMALWNREGSFA